MTKRSAIPLATALVASILVAAVALSMNFQIGTPAAANDAPVAVSKKAEKHRKPIVKRRTVTIHRTKPARTVGGGTVTVSSGSGSGGGSVSNRSASSGSVSSHDDSYEHETEDHSSSDHESESGDD